ncbi:MAG: hypothetical protein ACLT31_10675 [Lachnospiraceae bacterium]
MKDVKEQKQNDNGEIIEMKQGQVIKIPKNSGKAWLTLFYSLPQEFVSKRPVYLNFPRCPYEVLRTDKYDSLIKDDTFLELVWDCVAWSAWQYFEIPYQKVVTGKYRAVRHSIPGTSLCGGSLTLCCRFYVTNLRSVDFLSSSFTTCRKEQNFRGSLISSLAI